MGLRVSPTPRAARRHLVTFGGAPARAGVPLSRVASPPQFGCLRDSRGVAPSASGRAGLSCGGSVASPTVQQLGDLVRAGLLNRPNGAIRLRAAANLIVGAAPQLNLGAGVHGGGRYVVETPARCRRNRRCNRTGIRVVPRSARRSGVLGARHQPVRAHRGRRYRTLASPRGGSASGIGPCGVLGRCRLLVDRADRVSVL